MQKYLFLLYLSVLFLTQSYAQNLLDSQRGSTFTYVFEINEEEAKSLYAHNMGELSEAYFHSLVDSFPSAETFDKPLKDGHYLFVKAIINELSCELKTISDFKVHYLNNQSDFAIVIQDSKGNFITEAEVELKNRKVRFDKASQSYRLPKSKKEGLLKVKIGKQIIYEQVEARSYFYRRRALSNFFYKIPIRYLWKPPVDLFRDPWLSIRRHRPYGWVRRFANMFDVSYREESRERKDSYRFKGYMAFNQPMYRPKDSVKFKAFITKKGKKLFKKPAKVYLKKGRYNDELIWITSIDPYQAGGYSYTLFLHDSLDLQLDADYSIILKHGKKTLSSNSFRYEDYELNRNAFELKLAHEEQRKGIKQKLYMSGKDENDLNLLDARVELYVLTESVKEVKEDFLFIPDTLWTHQQKLDEIGETILEIPGSIFPNASLKYKLSAYFYNTDNELHIEDKSIDYDASSNWLEISEVSDSLTLSYMEEGISKQREATVLGFSADKEQVIQEAITLPTKYPIAPYVQVYELKTEDLEERHRIENDEGRKVSFIYTRDKDSLHIKIYNPLNLSVWYQLYDGNQEVLKGIDKNFHYNAKTSSKKNYTICWQYMWGGEIQTESVEIGLIENRLDISLEHPSKIYPGQEVEISIAVNDVEGEPVSKVDLTAYGIKSTFPDHDLPEIPAWEKGRETKYKGYSFRERTYPSKTTKKELNYDFWNKLMQLDSIAYYQFLYPKKGMFRFSYPAPDSMTQFAPFVVQNGDLQTVELIYVDNTPVYVGKGGNIQPYSFAIDSGYHKIEIRTQYHFLTLDSVFFEPTLKHILSIEADTAKSFIERRPSVLNEDEVNRILPYLMVVNRNQPSNFSYIKQGNRVFPIVSDFRRKVVSGSILIGPMLPQTFSFYHHYDSVFSISTHFEPNFEYEFSPDLVKMRMYNEENAMFGFSKYLSRSNNWNINLKDVLLKEQEIFKEWLTYKASLLTTENPIQTKHGNGRIRIKPNLPPDSLQPIMIFILEDQNPDRFRIYGENERTFHDFPPNTYDMLYLLSDSSFLYLSNVKVKADGLTSLDIKTPTPKHNASLKNLMRMIIVKRLAQKDDFDGDFQSAIPVNPSLNDRDFIPTGNIIRGQVLDVEGNPLVGASVLIKGTTIGTFTDENGYYSFLGTSLSTLIISYIGFETKEEEVRNQGIIISSLEGSSLNLDEVVVVGYGSRQRYKRKRSSSLAAVKESPSDDESSYWYNPFDHLTTTKKLNITGAVVTGQGLYKMLVQDPLVILDGVPYDGKVSDLDPNLISEIETLKGGKATGLYGVKAANGVVIITTSVGPDLSLLTENSLQPQQAYSIRSNFSDYAFWEPKLQTDREGKASFTTAFPDDITKWQLYAIGMDGKKHSGLAGSEIKSFKPVMAQLAMPHFLVEGDSVNIFGKIQNYSLDTLDAAISLVVDDKRLLEKNEQIQSSLIDTLGYKVKTTGTDSVTFMYSLKLADGYLDGEKRQIPIYPKGAVKTEGHYFALQSDTTVSVTLKNDVKWDLSAYSDPIDIMLNEIEHVRNYRYLCNEQVASKMKALLAEKRIKEWKGEKFKRQGEIRRLQKRLVKNQQADELWGWWAYSSKDYWVSRQVIDALVEARIAGFSDRTLNNSQTRLLLKEVEDTQNTHRLYSLEMLMKLDSTTNYLKWVNELEQKDSLSFSEQVRLSILRQKLNEEVDVSYVFKEQKETLLGNIYWGDEAYDVEENAISTTAYVYQLIKRSGKYDSLLPSIRAYFFERLEEGHWRNTYESTKVISTILPDIISSYQEIEPTELKIEGDLSKTITSFPYDTSFYASKSLNIQKSGTAPVYLSLSHQYRERNPVIRDDLFEVKSTFEGTKVSKIDSSTWNIRAGKPLTLKVQVEVKKKSEYVMVEVPIPSGCSYYRKRQTFGGVENYREYFHDRTSIFCSDLPAGIYTFEVELLPRYSGSFTLNPVRVEQMYFPVFEGNNEVKKVEIE